MDTLRPDKAEPPPVSTLTLRRAIFLYEESAPSPLLGQGRQYPERVMVCHDAAPDGTLGPARLLDPIALADSIVDAAARDREERLAYQTDRVLAQSRHTIVWWRPAGAAKLYFKTADDHPELTALNGRDIPLPALVFWAQAGSLRVWALRSDQRPALDTPLYGAPFMNIGGDGPHVCLGTTRSLDLRDAAVRASAPAEWERIFFESNFTHTPPTLAYEEGQTYASLLTNLAAVLASGLIATTEFPTHRLRPCAKFPTLAHALGQAGA